MTRLVWPRPHSNTIPTCRSGRPIRTSLATLARLLRGAGASCSVSGRVAVGDNETLGTVKGTGNLKGIAHVIFLDGTTAGKELIGRQKIRILFPGLPPKPCVNGMHAAVSARWAVPLVNSELTPGRGAWEREAMTAKWLFSEDL